MGIKMTEDVLAYENLVRHVVNKYNFRTDYDDLYQAGMMGLIMAFKKYDQTRESNFLDYAYFYIKGEVLKTLNSSKEVKISSDTYKLNKEINDTREDLVQRLGREPTPLELSYILGVSEEKITNTIIACQTACSLDDNNMDNDSSLYNKIALIEKGYDVGVLDLKSAINSLEESEKDLITSRYYEDLTQKETAELLGISQVQVSRKESKILQKIKEKVA